MRPPGDPARADLLRGVVLLGLAVALSAAASGAYAWLSGEPPAFEPGFSWFGLAAATLVAAQVEIRVGARRRGGAGRSGSSRADPPSVERAARGDGKGEGAGTGPAATPRAPG